MTAITQQPGALTPPPTKEMSTGLLSCCSDVKACCLGYWCLPCLMMKNAKRLGEHPCVCCCGASNVALRLKLRTMYGIKGTLCRDYCMATFCGACFECQTSRELDHLGVPE